MRKKRTTVDFITKAKEIHGDKYDYSKVEYVNSHTKVCVICLEHGEFWVTPNNHLRRRGCPQCKLKTLRNYFLKTTEQFIVDAQKVHGDKYDYSKVDYQGAFNEVTIICPIHGEFYQQPHVHLRGGGCSQCGIETIREKLRTSFDEFVERANKIHNNKYKYPQQEIKTQHDKITIICPIHGEFKQVILSHLQGSRCARCSKCIKKDNDLFIEEARQIHGDKYDYSKVEYKTVKDKVCIICPIHGEFWQTPEDHLHCTYGCPKCHSEEMRKKFNLGIDKFIEKARKIHGDKYDYSKVEYINNINHVCIICPKHGEFVQTPQKHLMGHGCPICCESKLEREIRLFLIKNNIRFVCQKRFPWLGLQSLDFFLPQYNIGIECQGEQHFSHRNNSYFFTKEKIEQIKKRDKKKAQLCEENDIKLLYYSNLGIDYPYHVFEDKEQLLEEIKKKC